MQPIGQTNETRVEDIVINQPESVVVLTISITQCRGILNRAEVKGFDETICETMGTIIRSR